MDERLFRYYEQELLHLRGTAAEFGREFPMVAGRLGLGDTECADPYVERLLEGFAFMAARVQLKLDSEFPRFTQGMLETVYPHYLCPTPSTCIVQLTPKPDEAALADGVRFERGRALRTHIDPRESTACEYRTAHELTLYPLRVALAEYHVSGVGALGGPQVAGQRAAVRIRLKTTGGIPMAKVRADRLTFFVNGAGGVAPRLYEALVARPLAVTVQPARTPPPWREHGPVGTPGSAQARVRAVGFEDDEALLPVGPRSFQGYRLLHEFFVLPQRYMFVEVTGLAPALARCTAEDQLDLIVHLSHAEPELEGVVTPENLRLFCTPAMNLFPKRLDRIQVTDRFAEFHAVPERTRPLDFEVYDVQRVDGYADGAARVKEFRPFYSAADADPSQATMSRAYFAVNRVPRRHSALELRDGPRSKYAGSEVYLSLVDAEAAPYRADLKQLGVEARCTNRDLPLRIPMDRATHMNAVEGAPLDTIRFVVNPTRPKSSFAEGEAAWRIISHLALNYFSLTSAEGGGGRMAGEGGGATALRELLRLYADAKDAVVRKQIDGVREVSSKPLVRRVPAPGPVTFARGLEVGVTLDEGAYEGVGSFVLGAVLDRFFAKYVSINSFTETVVRGVGRGEIMRWPARMGRRQTV